MHRVAVFLLFAAAAIGQPFVYYRGAVNSASFLPPGLPNGAIARGSMFSVFGRNLGPASAQQVSAFPLQATFAGVSVELSQGATKVNALPVYVSAGQLNVILPSNTPLGGVSLRVIYNGQTGNPIPINVAPTSIGLFSVNGGGFGPGIVQNFVSQVSQPINSLSATARPGQTEILWGTGIGAATFPDAVAPTAVTLDPTLELFVGGKKAVVSYAGRTPCCSSIDQIVFTVPTDAPSGCYVPVVARSRGVVVSNTVTMAIHSSGGSCSDGNSPLPNLRAGGKIAIAQLAREKLHVDVGVSVPVDVTLDHMVAAFRTTVAGDFAFSSVTSLPPAGSCTAYSGNANRLFGFESPFGPPGGQVSAGPSVKLEAGGTTINTPSASGFDGTYYALLGGAALSSGPFTLSGPGSSVAAAFRLVLDQVNPLSWTNRDQVREIDRSKDLVLTWTPVTEASRGVVIAGFGQRTSQNASAGFVCVAPSGASSFTVPAYVLAAMPASDGNDYFAPAQVSIANVPLVTSASLPGFDSSWVGVSQWTSKVAVTK